MVGVEPPLDTTGAVPLTLVTVPTLTEPPKAVTLPLMVIELFVNAPLGIELKFVPTKLGAAPEDTD